MSLKSSLQTLFNKLDQKNILLVSGNINELFYLQDIFPKAKSNGFVSLTDVIAYYCNHVKANPVKTVHYFSPSDGQIDYSLDKDKPQSTEEKEQAQNQDELGLDNTADNDLTAYLDQLNDEIKATAKNNNQFSRLDIIDCSDIFFDKGAMQGVPPAKLSQLIADFMEFNENIKAVRFITNFKKLILYSRNPSTLTNFFSTNNIEFASVVIQKPSKEERSDFFKTYSDYFVNVKDTIEDPDSDDFKDAVVITDGLSYREILQLAKLEVDSDEKYTFKQLYNIANFNKKQSEWESSKNFKDLNKISEELNKRVKGQDYAISQIRKTLIRSFTGLQGITQSSNSKKPKGILFFVGPTGVGKTEISKALCEYIFGDESRLIRFDMSEYNHEESDQKLIGAAPGYVGYDAGGQLTNAVKEKPFCILLFDEIEKAHNKILDKFLQILEDGRLTSSQGETVDFSETLIIFTSNIGTSQIKDANADKDAVHEQFINAVKDYFKNNLKRPEILNRIGEKNIIPFDFITDNTILDEILDMKLNKIISKLKEEKFIDLRINKADKEFLFQGIKDKYDRTMGGRGLMEKLETNFVDGLSEFIFDNYEFMQDNKNKKTFSHVTSKWNMEHNQLDYTLVK